MAAKLGFLAHRLDQHQRQRGIEDLQRDARETRTCSDINQAGGRGITPGQHAGQRIEEMLGADAFRLADSGQVKTRVPLQKLFFVAFEAGNLPGSQADSKQGGGILGKLFHRWKKL